MNTFLLILCTYLLGYGLYSCHFELEVNNEDCLRPLLELPAFVLSHTLVCIPGLIKLMN